MSIVSTEGNSPEAFNGLEIRQQGQGSGDLARIDPDVRQKMLEALLDAYVDKHEPSTSPAQTIEIHVPVNGEIKHVVFSDDSFNKSRSKQIAWAEELKGRLATQEESFAVARYLVGEEGKGSITSEGQDLLRIYREKSVRDSEGMVCVDNSRVYALNIADFSPLPDHGALVVLWKNAGIPQDEDSLPPS